jgi:hypothetical protein
VFMVGLIHGGPDVGFGVYGNLCPVLSHLTPEHLAALPAAMTAAFPSAESIALAGRLPGIMTAGGAQGALLHVDAAAGTTASHHCLLHAPFCPGPCHPLRPLCPPNKHRPPFPSSTLLTTATPHTHTQSPGVPIKAPIVDGLSGTVYAMEATIRALVARLPAERRASPIVAILGGGGYIGARLASVLATAPPTATAPAAALAALPSKRAASKAGSLLEPQSSLSLDVEVAVAEATAADMTAEVTLPGHRAAAASTLDIASGGAAGSGHVAFKQIIALDTRYAGRRQAAGGVLYTAEPTDLSAADVVLVITRNGDDVVEYVRHARPGQVRARLVTAHMHVYVRLWR